MENPQNINQTQPDLLDEFSMNLVQAGGGMRFVNLIIDLISFYVFILLLAAVDRAFAVLFVTPLLPTLVFAFYLSAIEAIFKGKTLGKVITGTRAVREDGRRITISEAFGRGFSRIVPFEAFSAFGSPSYPWHDRWTHTYVINERESTLPPAEE